MGQIYIFQMLKFNYNYISDLRSLLKFICVATKERYPWSCYSLSHFWLFATPWTVQPTSLPWPWDDFPGKNTGVGCHSLLQGIFPPKDWTHVSCIAGGFFTPEPPGKQGWNWDTSHPWAHHCAMKMGHSDWLGRVRLCPGRWLKWRGTGPSNSW